MSGNVPAVDVSIQTGLSFLKFSSNLPVIVPGVQAAGWGRAPIVYGALSRIPARYLEFVRLCHGNNGLRVGTQWGYGVISGRELAGAPPSFDIHIDDRAAKSPYEVRFSADTGTEEVTHVEADLEFRSLEANVVMRQFAQMPVRTFRDGIVTTRENGVGGIAIAGGVALIDAVARLKRSSGSDDRLADPTWAEVFRSITSGSMADVGRMVTPATAFYIASLFSEELYSGVRDGMGRMRLDEGERPLGVDDRSGGLLFDAEGPPLAERGGRFVRFESLERVRAFDPSGPITDNPRIIVRYVPVGGHSPVLADDVRFPMIEILQTTGFNPRGSEPFAEAVADFMSAVQAMYPGQVTLYDPNNPPRGGGIS